MLFYIFNFILIFLPTCQLFLSEIISLEDSLQTSLKSRTLCQLITREMQIKTIMRYLFTPTRMAIIKNPQAINAGGTVEIRKPSLHCWLEYKLVQPLWRTIWSFLKKLKIEQPYDPAIPLLGKYPERNQNLKRYMHCNVHCSTVW